MKYNLKIDNRLNLPCLIYCRKSFLGDKMKEESIEMVREKNTLSRMRMSVMLAIKKLMFGILSTLLNAHCSAGEEPDHGDQDKAHPHPGLDCACAAR